MLNGLSLRDAVDLQSADARRRPSGRRIRFVVFDPLPGKDPGPEFILMDQASSGCLRRLPFGLLAICGAWLRECCEVRRKLLRLAGLLDRSSRALTLAILRDLSRDLVAFGR